MFITHFILMVLLENESFCRDYHLKPNLVIRDLELIDGGVPRFPSYVNIRDDVEFSDNLQS